MSSDEGRDRDPNLSKKRKVTRACDNCRKKKIRCDSHDKPQSDPTCSHCTSNGIECTFIGVPRIPTAPKGYVEALEARCARLESTLTRYLPNFNVEIEIGPPLNRNAFVRSRGHGIKENNISAPRFGSEEKTTPEPTPMTPPKSRDSTAMPPSPQLFHNFLLSHEGLPKEEDVVGHAMLDYDDGEHSYLADAGIWMQDELEAQMRRLDLGKDFQKRFHGKSSGVTFVQLALNCKDEVLGKTPEAVGMAFALRSEYWLPGPWEEWPQTTPPLSQIRFPSPDLAEKLIDACFKQGIVMFPFMHRPSFERKCRAKLYKTDASFAKLYMWVCAVGSRFCREARTCYKSHTGEVIWHSAGWHYIKQAGPYKPSLFSPASLSELQCAALACVFFSTSTSPHAAWLTAATGLKLCQDLGAHRQKIYLSEHPLDREMWKRVFWFFIIHDILLSSNLGRPVAMQEDDFDVELPLEVDDEHYNETTAEWVQPSGKPSRLATMGQMAKLSLILGRALNTVFAINKTKEKHGFVGEKWEANITAELDSSLNRWQEELPAHLMWDPQAKETPFTMHAAALRLLFHFVQVAAHRTFIPATPESRAKMSLPSLTICVHASRASARVLEVYATRGYPPMPVAHSGAFCAGIMLSVGIWTVKRQGLNVDVSRHFEDVDRCKNALALWEEVSLMAGKFRDILMVLAPSRHDPQFGPLQTMPTQKRARDVTSISPNPGVAPAPPSVNVTANPWPNLQATVPLKGPQSSSLPVFNTSGTNNADLWGSVMNELHSLDPDWLCEFSGMANPLSMSGLGLQMTDMPNPKDSLQSPGMAFGGWTVPDQFPLDAQQDRSRTGGVDSGDWLNGLLFPDLQQVTLHMQ